MRISDWSSDVCSSDLTRNGHLYQAQVGPLAGAGPTQTIVRERDPPAARGRAPVGQPDCAPDRSLPVAPAAPPRPAHDPRPLRLPARDRPARWWQGPPGLEAVNTHTPPRPPPNTKTHKHTPR